jgi:Tol biopolymer transport system component
MHYERVEWLPNGEKLLFTGNEPNRPMRSYLQDIRGGVPLPVTPEGMPAMHVSPDGKYVAAVVAGKLNLLPIADAPAKVIDVETGESVIRWSADGRYVFLRQNEGLTAMKINRLDLTTKREEPWKELKLADPVGVQIGGVVMTPDGNAYAYSFQRDICTLYLADALK